MALRLACHDAEVHRRLVPQAPEAKAVFEAVEQARVEAIGAQSHGGRRRKTSPPCSVIATIAATSPMSSKRSEAPIEEAIAMIVRERLTGAKPPKTAQKMVDLWRPWVEERASADLDRLAGTLENQRTFGRAVQKILVSLDMIDESALDDEDTGEDIGAGRSRGRSAKAGRRQRRRG